MFILKYWKAVFFILINSVSIRTIIAQETPIYSTLQFYKNHSFYPFSVRPIYDTNYFIVSKKKLKSSRLNRKIFHEHLFEISKNDFIIRGDVYLNTSVGSQLNYNKLLYDNSRGLGIEGKLGGLSFYTQIYENQFLVPTYLNNYINEKKVYPGLGYNFNNSPNLYDFSYGVAGVSYKFNKYFTIQLANDKIFIGNGYRSLLLSDATAPYPYFRLTTQVGRFQYTNIYAQGIDINQPKISYDIGYRRKFITTHFLEYGYKRFHIGIFETIIYQKGDSLGYRGFELGYLNPVIFLRPAEYVNGSSDNVLIGLNTAFDLTKHTQLYCQLIIDELKFSEVFNRRGWWGNKQGIQLGIKTKKLFNSNQWAGFSEWNIVRPYTYTSRNSVLSYSNYNEPLAHTLGANFIEWVNRIEWQKDRFYINYQLNLTRYGLNGLGFRNVGQNILQSYNTRDKEFGNFIAQGLPVLLVISNLQLGYIINFVNNFRVEFQYLNRYENFNKSYSQANIFYLGFKSSFRNVYLDK